jgi:CRISPR/Cas system CSM-associated protein Csm3 (group 7 of RAMP superfamily)
MVTHDRHRGGGAKKNDTDTFVATAPYNFVSLPYEILDDGTADGKYVPKYTTAVSDRDCELYSGTITCTLKALTPLIVAGPSNRNNQKEDRRFLEVDGKKVIMGSSLKGMFRGYIEAFSCSAIHPVTDSFVFWRNVTGSGSGEYKNYFEDKPKGGFLKKEGARYKFYRTASEIKRAPEREPGVYCTGKMFKKYDGYDFGKPEAEGVFLDDEIVSRFLTEVKSNENRKRIWQKELDSLEKNGYARVFCIYHKSGEKKGQVKELGIARYMRIPYPRTPAQLAGNFTKDDFCAHLFGYVNGVDKDSKARKGKLSFSECRLENAHEQKTVRLVLGTPHPTCIQHYVDQWVDENNVPDRYRTKNNPDRLFAYNEGNALRGRKFYWHRKPQQQKGPIENEKIQTNFRPVGAGAEGTFTISLNSVNELELGAILEMLNIPKDSAFKLGMAKPYGYGSVSLTIKSIDLEKDTDRYASISNRLMPASASVLNESQQKTLIRKFEEYVFKCVNDGVASSYEELLPIADLREMMLLKDNTYDRLSSPEWEAKTAYMGIKDCHPNFKDKKILPYADHVKLYK